MVARRDALRLQWARIETLVIGALVVLALAVYLYGFLIRSVAPALAVDWAEEVTIYLIVWATLLCGGSLIMDRAHVSADMLGRRLSSRSRRRLQTGIDLLVLAFCSLMLWLGAEAVIFAQALDERSASTLQAPQAWVLYLALPVGMLLMVVRLLLLLLANRADVDA